MNLKHFYFLSLAICLAFAVPGLAVAQIDTLPAANDKAVLLRSAVMGEDRTLWIHLPANYSNTTNTYPVLYLLDGDGHFGYVSGMTDYLAGYDRNRIPDMIVVGIVNVDRGRDFTPVHPEKANGIIDSSSVLSTVGAGKFLQFVSSEVVPYIDQHYRVQPYRVLAGHSLGGLFAFYVKEKQPELFPATILISPAINGVNDKMLGEFGPFLKKARPSNQKLFIGIGNEGTDKVEAIKAQLSRVNPNWLSWDYKQYADENHFSVTYKALFDGLKFIYKDWFFDFYSNTRLTYADIVTRYKKLSDEFGYAIKPNEEFLNNCGYNQLRAGYQQNAIGIFTENVKQHPSSYNAYDSLAEAYMKAGNKDLAIKNYKRSIELNPHNTDGIATLKKLEESK